MTTCDERPQPAGPTTPELLDRPGHQRRPRPAARIPSRPTTGALLAAGALLLLGSTAPVAATLDGVPLLAGQGLRFAISGATLSITLVIIRRSSRLGAPAPRTPTLRLGDLGRFVALGTVGIAGFTAAFVLATDYADPALVGSVLAATPVALAVIGPVLRGRRPAGGVILGAAIVATGTTVATGAGSSTLAGVLLSLVALGCEVAFTLLALPLIDRYGPLITTTFALSGGALVLLLASVVIEGPDAIMIAATADHLPALLFLALAVSVGATLSWYAAMPMIGPDRGGLFYAFSPIGALLAGLGLHTSSPGIGEFAGLALVLGGLIIGLRSSLSTRRPRSGDIHSVRPHDHGPT